jgi:hypothetical protein
MRNGDEVSNRPLHGCTSGPRTAYPRIGGAQAAVSLSVYAVQPLYVLPEDGIDRGLASDGTIERSVSAMQNWLADQTGGRRLRFVDGPVETYCVGKSDEQIAATGDAVRDELEKLLRHEGYNDPSRVYAVWYDGTSHHSCGGGAWPPSLRGSVAALYLQGSYTVGGQHVDCSQDRFSFDGVTPQLNEFKMLHEILHTLGIVSQGAPHHTQCGHVSDDPRDLMYAGNQPWQPSVLDVVHDDYYLTGRTDIVDLSRSVFLDPLPPDAVPPP